MSLQDEVIILSSVNNFLWELQSLSNKVLIYSPVIDLVLLEHIFQTKLDDIAQDVDILTDAERLERSMGNLISINNFLNYNNY